MPENNAYSVLVAHISASHGVSGSVRLKPAGENAELLARALPVGRKALGRREDGTERILTVFNLRKQTQAKGSWLIRFEEAKDRTASEGLRGFALYIREDERPELPVGEHYVDDLRGLNVVTDKGRSLGQLSDVLNSPAHDVYETTTGVLIPVVSEFILSVNLQERTILVKDVPGLGEDDVEEPSGLPTMRKRSAPHKVPFEPEPDADH